MAYSDKQVQIIDTAEKLFATKGFSGTSVRDIAEEADVNVAMISYYFGSKEKLMEALFEQRVGDIRMRIESLIKDESLTPFQKVSLLIDEHIEKVLGSRQFFKIMHCEQLINKNPAVLKMLMAMKKRNAEIIAELIKDGQKKGAFKKKVDVILMVSTMVGTVTQMMINHDFYREFNNLQSMPDKEFDTLLKKNISIHVKNLFKAILNNES